jgi:hypothetical protein
MLGNRSFLQIARALSICAFSIFLLLPGFYKNSWRVANQQWFDNYQRDMESFIIGRMVKSRQNGIFSSGGLTGQGRLDARVIDFDDPSGEVNPSTNQENQYQAYFNRLPFVTYTTYNSQIGGQGMFFCLLDRWTTFPPEKKFHFFQALTSLLTAMTITAIVLWFYREFGLTVALFVLASSVCSQWLVVFGRNLWWSTWSFYLPVAVMMHYLRFEREPFNIKPFTLGVTVFLTIFVKCLFTGYEYITTTLVMMTVPLVYYGILKGWSYRKFLIGFSTAAFSSCVAILFSFVILCFQVRSVKGSFRDGVNHIVYALAVRTHANPHNFSAEYTASLESGSVQVVTKYLKGTFFDAREHLSFSNDLAHFASAYLLKWTYGRLILLFIIMSGLLYILRNRCSSEEEKGKRLALILATWFSILAPLSWFVIFKAHSYIHTHMNFVVWQMPFVFFGFAVCGLVVKSLLPEGKNLPRPKTGMA